MAKSMEKENALILSAINADGYTLDKQPETDAEKLKFLRDTFYSEYGWLIKRDGESKALRGWLMGLPSSINIPFYNHDIIALAKAWGSLPENATERQEDKILDNYWNFMAMRILSLWHKNKTGA